MRKLALTLDFCLAAISESTKRRLLESAAAVQCWVEANGYRGYEPFDGLSSPLRSCTFGNLLAERILQQAVRQSPLNIRPLIGIKPLDSTKGRGMMAWGYLLLHRTTGIADYWTKAVECLRWLDTHRSPKFEKHSWANYFDFSSRGGTYRKDDSIIVWTSQIAQAYLEAFEQSQDQWFLDIASSACDWIMSLPRERTDRGDCLSYFAHGQESIHNANMLGAAALARTARQTGRQDYADVARAAMRYSCLRMLPNGAWWYAEDDQYHWIDNFHTGYNLDSLKCYIECTGDTEFSGHLTKGLRFFKSTSFSRPGARSTTTIAHTRSTFSARHRRSTRSHALLRKIPSRSLLPSRLPTGPFVICRIAPASSITASTRSV